MNAGVVEMIEVYTKCQLWCTFPFKCIEWGHTCMLIARLNIPSTPPPFFKRRLFAGENFKFGNPVRKLQKDLKAGYLCLDVFKHKRALRRAKVPRVRAPAGAAMSPHAEGSTYIQTGM